jgi:two-component system, OmpR family, response regulator CpxR
MPVVTIFSGAFCHGEKVSTKSAERLGYELLNDAAFIAEAAQGLRLSEDKVSRTLSGKVSSFDAFTHERKRIVAHLKKIMALTLERDNLVLFGACSQLIPRSVSHVLKVGIIAEIGYRVELVMAERGVSRKEAVRILRREDEAPGLWVDYLYNSNPWDPELYDLLIPTDKKTVDEAVSLIMENTRKVVLQPTQTSLRAVADFRLAAEVEVALAGKGHAVGVEARDGTVTLTINKHVLLLSRLENELKQIIGGLPGVKEVETKVGPEFYRSDIYRQADFETPSKVLLVDDEREFVQTLSERLLMRDVGSAVVYDGEQALSFVHDDEPDVVVLDLKMPGIDGIEVLRRLKQTHPHIEVIILTGHGTPEDEQTCKELGAFAYLQKPVDIDILSQTMKEAYRRIRGKNAEDRP